jgi:hypothetical protein
VAESDSALPTRTFARSRIDGSARPDQQGQLFCCFNLEEVVPEDHQVRRNVKGAYFAFADNYLIDIKFYRPACSTAMYAHSNAMLREGAGAQSSSRHL